MALNTVGQARIELVPDLTGFHKKAQREVRQMPDIVANVKMTPDLSGFRKEVVREATAATADVEIAVKVVPDVRTFRRDLKTAINSGPNQAVEVDVQANTTQFIREIRRATSTSPPATIRVDADTTRAARRIDVAARNRRTTLNVDADTGMATAQMGVLAGTTTMAGAAATFAGHAFRGMGLSAVGAGVAGAASISLIGLAIVGIIGLIGIAAGAIGILGVGLIGLGVAAVPALGAIALGFEGIKNAAGEAKAGFDALKSSMSTALEETMRPGFAALGSLLQEIIPQAQNVGRAFGEVFTGISTLLRDDLMGEIRTMMDGMAVFIRALQPGLETMIVGFMNLGAVFAQNAQAVGEGLGAMLGHLGAVFTRLESMGTLQALFQALGPVLASTGALVGGLVEALALAGQVMAPVLAPLLDSMTAVLPGLGIALGAIGNALSQVLIALMPIFGPLSSLLVQIAPALSTALVPVAQALVGIVTMLAPMLGQYVEILAPVLSAILLMVGDVLVAVMPMVQVFLDLMGQMAPIFVQIVGHIANLLIMLAPVLTALVATIAPVIPVLAQAFLDVVEALMPLMPQLAQLAMDLMPVLGFVVENVVIPAIRFLAWFIIPFLVVAAEGVIRVIGQVIGVLVRVKDWLVTAGHAVLDFGDWIGRMARAVWEEGERALQWFRDLPGMIQGYLADAGSWLVDTGRNLIDGLVSGIKSAGSAVKDAILALVPDAIEGPIKKALGIRSPSRLMMEVGGYVGEGLAIGMEKTIPEVQAKGMALAAAADPSTPAGAPAPTASPVIPNVTPTVAADPNVDVTGMAEAVEAALTGVAAPAWETYGQTVQGVQAGVLAPATGAAASAVSSMVGSMGASLGRANASVVNTGNVMVSTVQGQMVPALGVANASVRNTGAVMASITTGQMIPSWTNAGNQIRAVQAGPMETAFRETRNSVQYTANTFGPAADNISVQWGRLREGTAAPVRWSIQNVFNDGVVGSWNSVSELLGTKKMGAYPIRFATGGVMPGYTPGQDVHRFTSPTGGVLELSGGEAIMRPEWTRMVGGPAAVDRMNQEARTGRLNDPERRALAQAHANGGVMRFAGGGIVAAMTRIVKQKYPAMLLTSGQRASNDNHGRGMAGDFAYPGAFGPHPAQLALANDIANTYPGSMELIYGPPFPRQIKNGRIVGNGGGSFGFYAGAGDHTNHVHWAMNTPPTIPFGGGVFAGGSGGEGGVPVMSMADMLAEKTDPIWKKVGDKVAATNFPGMTQPIPKGYLDSYKKATDEKIQKLAEAMTSFADPGGAGVQRWRPLVETLLKRYGHSLSNTDLTLRRMNQESGGNPRAINNWDSNAAAGIPSKGLMQVIDPTFAAHRDPALSPDIWDPMANVAASMRYAMSRYGSLAAAYNRPGGYDAGGWLDPGISTIYNGFVKPEAILSPAESERFVNIADAFLDHNMAGGSFVGQHVENQYVMDPDEVQAKTRRGVRRAMKEAGVRG